MEKHKNRFLLSHVITSIHLSVYLSCLFQNEHLVDLIQKNTFQFYINE